LTDCTNRAGTEAAGSTFELDTDARRLLEVFSNRCSEQLDGVASELSGRLVSDGRATSNPRAASTDPRHVTSMARRWLDDVLLQPDRSESLLLELFEASELPDVPVDCLVQHISLVRRRLIALVLASSDRSAVAATVDAIERAIDLQFARLLETHRQILLERSMASERLATIGQLVASIGHELRNPLGTIETCAYLLSQRLANLAASEPSALKQVDKIRTQVRVATKIVTDLLEMARNRPPRRTRFELLGLIETTVDSLSWPDHVSIRSTVPEQLTVWGDADQLRVVLVNLLTNAVDAIGTQGTIAVTATESEGGICLFVSDDGPGIGEAGEHRIFETLYTTKPNGSGLGLPLCRRIVRAHGGELSLQPSERGATFRLWLPGQGCGSQEENGQ
jgi:signal transduction histidine kinase